MSDDELTITWPDISDTSDTYNINLDSMGTVSSGGAYVYSANTNNTIWTTNTTTGSNPQFNNWNIGNSNVVPTGQLSLVGDNADIVINGQSLNDTLTIIQERLGMLVPNAEMEA
jgi:hypothetical protein